MRRSKKLRECQDGNCLDRISSLPDDVLGHMLSFLPTTHAVRTSILSARWRRLFTLTACLSFNDEIRFGFNQEKETIDASRRFKEFVDKVLGLHQVSPIKKFSLLCGGIYDNSDLKRWISNVLQKGVQELHYRPPVLTDYCCVPDGFFVCGTLVKLHLDRMSFGQNKIEIPLSAWLPKLKILHLDRISFSDFNSMERLFSSCELLEELTLRDSSCHISGHSYKCIGILKVLRIEHCRFRSGTFEIDAPNLAYLTYSTNIGLKIVLSWKNSSFFKGAELNFRRCNEDSIKYDLELLKAVACKATKLYFETDLIKLFLRLDDDEQRPEFHSLSSLDLGACSWKYVISLLDKSPQLKTVDFESGFLCCCNSKCDCLDHCDCNSLSRIDIPLVPFSCHADVIKVHDFCGHRGPMLLMGHLLRNASVLRSLIVYPVYGLRPDEEMRICKALLKLPRASTDCCVEMI
ncbi:F-box/LRR-repeat protein At4g14103-like [Silene latifolia]|uniref:F-box/LRR-repeat protein At4g14103-like n=1 Tax=Silene latifolia TaxID=37657 RepID=UPI003D772EE4